MRSDSGSAGSAQRVKVNLSSFVCGEMQRDEFVGVMKTLGGSRLVQYTDSGGVKTSLKLDEKQGKKTVHILRSGGASDHRLSVMSGCRTSGVMGETPFSVIGKRGDWSFSGSAGEIRLNYILPDLSDEPMEFNIRISFTVCKDQNSADFDS